MQTKYITTIVLCVISLMVGGTAKADLIINGPPIGNPSVSNSLGPVSGKLVDVDAAFSSMGEIGEYTEYPSSGNYISIDLDIRPKECCIFGEPGKEPEFKADLSTITYTFDPQIKMPSWSDRATYGNTCPSAGAEWDRVYNAILAHENLHSNAAKSVLTASGVKSYYSGITDRTGNCVPEEDYDSYEETFFQLLLADIQSADSNLQSALDMAQASVDITNPPGLIVVDTSKDCP